MQLTKKLSRRVGGCLVGVLSLIGIVTVIVVVGGHWIIYRADLCPVQPELLKQLRKGMTEDEVRELLSGPSSVSRDGLEWYYTKPLSTGVVHVRFEAGRVIGYYYDP